MTDPTPSRPRTTPMQWVARGLMATLWAAGSAYLIAHALAHPNPSWVEIISIPVLWAAAIAAPIIAHHAFGNRDIAAAGLLVAASVIGSAWTLSGTIARQSEGADERLAVSAQVERQRRDLVQKLGEANEILAKHRKTQAIECASGVGKRCAGVTYTVNTWAAAVEGYEAKLKALPSPQKLDAGAKRIAALLALLPGVTKPVAQLEAEVQLVAPILFGVFVELAALAFGFFGFRARPVAAPVPVPLPLPAPVMASPSSVAHQPTRTSAAEGSDALEDPMVRRKLTKAQAEARVLVLKRPASQDLLARRWGVTEAAISQWVSDWEARGLVSRVRHGRCKLVQVVQPSSRRLRVVRAA